MKRGKGEENDGIEKMKTRGQEVSGVGGRGQQLEGRWKIAYSGPKDRAGKWACSVAWKVTEIMGMRKRNESKNE